MRRNALNRVTFIIYPYLKVQKDDKQIRLNSKPQMCLKHKCYLARKLHSRYHRY